MDMWHVHTKGGPNQSTWEICVLHKDYAHGAVSYGWFGDRKIYISSNGGPCHDIVSPEIWADLVAVAEREAERRNHGHA